MGKINILSKHMSELIAAGEVVERPASVVKELVENSIDSNAKNITVEIKNGGTSFIRITDDGCGIVREDVPIAFLRHATSKIKEQDDLESIYTLGFRGEALASISAVSQVELITRTKDELAGTCYLIDGGEEQSIDDIGCACGTTIIVRNLFYNTPARIKFLKKDTTEANAGAGILVRIALSHPEISFKFIKDGKEQLNTPGNGDIKSCIHSVFGREFVDSLQEVKYEFNSVRVYGFVNKPDFARSNRGMQYFFVNGRYVKSKTAMVAMEQAFKGDIMVGKFPSCVLYIELAVESTDVNVHPSKLEIKFINEKPVFDAVYYAVKNSLNNNNITDTIVFSNDHLIKQSTLYQKAMQKHNLNKKDNEKKDNTKKEEYTQLKDLNKGKTMYPISSNVLKKTVNGDTTKKFKPNSDDNFFDEPEVYIPQKIFSQGNKLNDFDYAKNMYMDKTIFIDKNLLGVNEIKNCKENDKGKLSIKNGLTELNNVDDLSKKKKDNDKQDLFIEDEISTQSVISNIRDNQNSYSPKFIGELFNTYILIEKNKTDLIIIDKHAAHERIIYEELVSKNTESYSQVLVNAVTVTLEKNEYDAIINNLSDIQKAGFEISDFGSGTVIVRAAPIYLDISSIKDSVIEIAGYILENRNNLKTNYVDWLYHNIACRAAIKAGKNDKKEELVALVEELNKNNLLKHCPHGRPIFVTIKKSEIEKYFGRT